jgi:hypothetical protein
VVIFEKDIPRRLGVDGYRKTFEVMTLTLAIGTLALNSSVAQ